MPLLWWFGEFSFFQNFLYLLVGFSRDVDVDVEEFTFTSDTGEFSLYAVEFTADVAWFSWNAEEFAAHAA